MSLSELRLSVSGPVYSEGCSAPVAQLVMRSILAFDFVAPLLNYQQLLPPRKPAEPKASSHHGLLRFHIHNPFARSSSVTGGSPRLPLEIYQEIIDCVAARLDDVLWPPEKDPWRQTLLSCAFVCRAWHHHALFYLRQYVELRDRRQVVSLAKYLRDEPQSRQAVKFVDIAGAQRGSVHPIPHLGTFASMLAGKLPNANTLRLDNAEWIVGSIAPISVRHLAFFPLTTLDLRNVCFPTVSQLAQLISALPALHVLKCKKVYCKPVQLDSAMLPPGNAANLVCIEVWWETAPAVIELFVECCKVARLERLAFGVDYDNAFSNHIGRQDLINACATSLRTVRLDLNTYSLTHADIGNIVQHVNLSRVIGLERLVLDSRSFLGAEHSWMPQVLSTVESKRIQRVKLLFIVGPRLPLLRTMLTSLERLDVFDRLDEVLSRGPFANIPPDGVCLGINISLHASLNSRLKINEEEERWDRWDKLVRKKMPRTNKRGILCTRVTRNVS